MLFTINQTTAPTRRETRDGREFLVVPVVALREGILNGELMLTEEFSHGFEAWNGRPVTIGHPHVGKDLVPSVSANTPEMLEKFQVGQLFNTGIKGDRMVSEMWIDLSKVPLVDGGEQAVAQFESAVMTDVSTAYLRDLEDRPGTFDGEPHSGVQRNIKPDHLAILLSEEGACSIKDGCGAPRINKQEGAMETEQTNPDADKSEKTQSWLVRQVQKLARKSNTKLEANMAVSKEELVRHLLNAEGHTFNEEDLTPLSQSALEKLAVLLASNAPPDEDTEDDGPAPEIPGKEPELEDEMEVQSNEEKQGDKQEQPCADPRLDAIEAQLAGIAAQLTANADAEKAELVEAITANSTMTGDQLTALAVPALQALRASIVPADYSGQGGGPQAPTGEQTYTI